MEKTNKICWLRGHSFGALLLAILSIVSINCNHAQAGILRLDDIFTATFSKSGFNDMAFLSDIVEQKDGKILLAGFYDTIDGTPLNFISRVTPVGILDPDFNVGSGTDQWVTQVGVQPDGRIILAGQFGLS